MAEFGFASDPFADFDGRETKDGGNGRSSRGHRSGSREKVPSSRPSKSSSGSRDRSSDRDHHGRDRSSDRDRERDRDSKDRERRHRSSKDRERSTDRDRERSSDRDRERSSDRDRVRHHPQHHHSSKSNSSRNAAGSDGAAAFDLSFDTAFGGNGTRRAPAHEAGGRMAGTAADPLSSPPAESRMRRMRRASVSAGTSAPLVSTADGSTDASGAPASGRVRRPRRTSLVGDASTTAASSGAALGGPAPRRLPPASRSSDGLEDMRHNLRSGLPEGLNVAASQPLRPQRRAGRRASLVRGSGGVSARNVRGEFIDEEVTTTVSPEIRGFLEERTDRQRKLMDKFRHLNLDDDASVANPPVSGRRKDGGAGPALASAVRTDLMLQQAAAQDRRSWRRSSLMGALSGVVGGGGTAGAAALSPEPIRDEPERKNGGRSSGRDRRSLRSKSDSGEVISYDPTRDRTRGGGLLDRVGATGSRSPMDRASSGGANGKSYSDRIMQGR